METFDHTDYDFTPTFEQLYAYLDGLIDVGELMFLNITNREEIDLARSHLNTIDELKKLKDVAGRLQERMEEIRDNDLCLQGGSAQRATTSGGLRTIEVEITNGMLRQSLLTITQAKKSNLVKIGEQFRIRLPGGEEFVTDLIEPGNKLRERGRIRAFYELRKIEPGDRVVLKELEKGIWAMEAKYESQDPFYDLKPTTPEGGNIE